MGLGGLGGNIAGCKDSSSRQTEASYYYGRKIENKICTIHGNKYRTVYPSREWMYVSGCFLLIASFLCILLPFLLMLSGGIEDGIIMLVFFLPLLVIGVIFLCSSECCGMCLLSDILSDVKNKLPPEKKEEYNQLLNKEKELREKGQILEALDLQEEIIKKFSFYNVELKKAQDIISFIKEKTIVPAQES